MEKDCECNFFDGKIEYYSEFLKSFNIIASSNILDDSNTTILKCKTCDSYYIWDGNSKDYDKEEKILAKRYTPKTDDDGLRRILEKSKGIISEKNIDERSNLLEKLRRIELNRVDEGRIDENKN